MQDERQIAKLARLADMVKAASLARLRASSDQRKATLTALDELNGRSSAAAVTEEPGDLRILSRHLAWQQQRRASFNIRLAAQTAEWHASRDRAIRDLARADIAGQLAERAARTSRRAG
jgi:endonuclease/exonuclease/phosphatase family metal-dependent hydrolase